MSLVLMYPEVVQRAENAVAVVASVGHIPFMHLNMFDIRIQVWKGLVACLQDTFINLFILVF